MISVPLYGKYLIQSFSCTLNGLMRKNIKHIHTAQVNLKKRIMKIHWDQHETTLHPFVWLRDCCQCERCTHPVSKRRLVKISNLRMNAIPYQIDFLDEPKLLKVLWDDGHISPFSYGWLKDRSFTPERQIFHSQSTHENKREYWSGQFEITKYSYDTLFSAERSIHDLIETLKVWGICVINNAPCNRQRFEDNLFNLGYPLKMINGSSENNVCEDSFKKIVKPDVQNHRNVEYSKELPSIEFIHRVKPVYKRYLNAQFVDGFFVAELLRQNKPEVYNILTNTVLKFWEYGTDHLKSFRMVSNRPTIKVDCNNKPLSISYNQSMRDSFLSIPIGNVNKFYEALKLFDDTLRKHIIFYELSEGDIVVFDNRRVLHGTKGINEKQSPDVICGAYLSWEEAENRLRLVQEKFSTAKELT